MPTLYSLPSTDFHSVASNRPGRAAVTGLGSPDGPALIADLVASNLTVPLTTSGVNTSASLAAHLRKARKAAAVHPGRHAVSKAVPVTPAASAVPAASHALPRPTVRIAHERHR